MSAHITRVPPFSVRPLAGPPISEDRVEVTSPPAAAGSSHTLVREWVRGPERVERLSRALAWSRLTGWVTDANGATSPIEADDYVADHDHPLRWSLAGPLPVGDLTFALDMPYSVLHFTTGPGVQVEGGFATQAPRAFERARGHDAARHAMGAPTHLEFQHPRWPEEAVRVRVRDVGYGGMRLADPSDGRLLYRGLEVRARLSGGALDGLVIEGEFRYQGLGAGGLACISLVPKDDAQSAAWRDQLEPRLDPDTSVAGADPADSWALFGRCGYFDLSGKSEDDFAALESAHAAVVRAYESHPAVGVHAVWTVDGGVAASLAAARVSRTAWFGLHLAKDSGDVGPHRGFKVLRAVHRRVYEHIGAHRDTRWMVGLFQRSGSWSSYVHANFPEPYLESATADSLGVSVWELPAAPGAPGQRATPAELPGILSHLRARHTDVFCDAFDLSIEELGLKSTNARYRAAGLGRERVVFVAREGGRVVSYALAERTSPGVHVYGLLNAVWTYAVEPHGISHFDALLASAGAWYHEHGSTEFIYLRPLARPFAPSAGRHLSAADLTFVSTSILPDLTEHIWEATARPSVGKARRADR